MLTVNDRWWGAKPITKRITAWPRALTCRTASTRASSRWWTSQWALRNAHDTRRLPAPGNSVRRNRQLIFSAQGPLAAPPTRRAVALCVPRDLIARNAEVEIANARLSPSATTPSATPRAHSRAASTASRIRMRPGPPPAINPLTVRIGYQAPNPGWRPRSERSPKRVRRRGSPFRKSRPAQIGPQTLRDGQIDVLLASTGGASGSGSTGSSSMDAYALRTGNGNNLSGCSNPQIDGIISALAVTTDLKEQARLLGDAAPILWATCRRSPLYRQQRTVLFSKKMYGVEANPTKWGAGWNMDRWVLENDRIPRPTSSPPHP